MEHTKISTSILLFFWNFRWLNRGVLWKLKKVIKKKLSLKRKSFKSKMEIIDSYLEKIKKYKKEYIDKKKKERSILKRVVHKFVGADKEIKEQWIDEVI